MARTYSQIHRTDKYSQHSSTICPVWLNGWVLVYELSGCGFESNCNHFNFRFRACFEQGVPWHSSNYRVWIHSETRTWHDKNLQTFNLVNFTGKHLQRRCFLVKFTKFLRVPFLQNTSCGWFWWITRNYIFGYWETYIKNKAKGRISKQVFQENEARQIFRKTNISYPLTGTFTCAYQVVRNVCF